MELTRHPRGGGKGDLAGAGREPWSGRQRHDYAYGVRRATHNEYLVNDTRSHALTYLNLFCVIRSIIALSSIVCSASSYLETYEPQQHSSISSKAQDKGTEKTSNRVTVTDCQLIAIPQPSRYTQYLLRAAADRLSSDLVLVRRRKLTPASRIMRMLMRWRS